MERDWTQFVKITLILLISSLILGCDKSRAQELGVAFNAKRAQVALPPLPSNWIVAKDGPDVVGWNNPKAETATTPLHSQKEIRYDQNGIPTLEIDTYYSGRTFETMDGKVWEFCATSFDFQKYARGQDPWDCGITNGPDEGNLDLDGATKVLVKWGITRLAQ